MQNSKRNLDSLWAFHNEQWREPSSVVAAAVGDHQPDPRLLNIRVQGEWWSLLDALKVNLLVGREYEHLLIMLGSLRGRPHCTYFPTPHPSGMAVDRKNRKVYVACTRNPNQILTFQNSRGLFNRRDLGKVGGAVIELPSIKQNSKSPDSVDNDSGRFGVGKEKLNKDERNYLMPIQSQYFPGSLYIHDMAVINNDLYVNAVGHNTIIKTAGDGGYEYVWWPKCVDHRGKPRTEANYLQLNSIAAGKDIRHSFFTASTARISSRQPGHRNFLVDKQGVVFSGATREPMCRGLTRPHSARLHKGKIWLNNSGYGEWGRVEDRTFRSLLTLPGWTRGLCLYEGIAFVGTSRVIPRFKNYAPGLDVRRSLCGIFAIELKSQRILGSIQWPYGNQIFALEWIPQGWTDGFPYLYLPKKKSAHIKQVFYTFQTRNGK